MSVIQAVVLAIIQGLTEFLPISSSGHLITIPWLVGWKEHSLTFDVMLHAGTLVAILAYFWSDWASLLKGTVKDLRTGSYWKGTDSRLVTLILLATIPGGLAGMKLENKVEGLFRTEYLGIAIVMIGVGTILLITDRIGRKARQVEKVGVADAVIVGISQAFALFPGVSRSGATITAGLFAGLTREAAARLSFLLATPIILGASLKKLAEISVAVLHHKPLEDPVHILLIGFLVSAVVGYAAIAWLLGYLRRGSMLPFVLYRAAFGLLIIAVLFLR